MGGIVEKTIKQYKSKFKKKAIAKNTQDDTVNTKELKSFCRIQKSNDIIKEKNKKFITIVNIIWLFWNTV